MKFDDKKTCREHRFSIGVEKISGKFYLSIPVSNSYVDYEEYYEITEEMFLKFESDMTLGLEFVQQCREMKNDNLLLEKPGRLRGHSGI